MPLPDTPDLKGANERFFATIHQAEPKARTGSEDGVSHAFFFCSAMCGAASSEVFSWSDADVFSGLPVYLGVVYQLMWGGNLTHESSGSGRLNVLREV